MHADTKRPRPQHFFKYCSFATAKKVLETATARWNNPSNFNDPFDCRFSTAFSFSVAEARPAYIKRALEVVTGSASPNFNFSNPMAVPMAMMREAYRTGSLDVATIEQGLMDGIEEDEAAVAKFTADLGNDMREIALGYRIFCVCEEVDNQLLWAHYADCHKGVAFKFECRLESDSPLRIAFPIDYRDEAPGIVGMEDWIEFQVGVAPQPDFGEVVRRVVSTKAAEWSYEHEWRVLVHAKDGEPPGHADYGFDPLDVSAIYLGCKMDEANKSELLAVASARFGHAEIHVGRLHESKYKVEFDRIG